VAPLAGPNTPFMFASRSPGGEFFGACRRLRGIMARMLTVSNLTMTFGGLKAVQDLSFQARRGEITAVIGPNGAGKTTVFNCVTGFYRPTEGSIVLAHDSGAQFALQRMAALTPCTPCPVTASPPPPRWPAPSRTFVCSPA
jgi:ABC-type multidrug transport system fused ATPase/permease subunit